jgi:hypothetical protein
VIDMGDLYSTPRTSLRSDARISLTLLRRARRPPARRPRIPCRTMFAVPDTVKQTASTVWSALQPLKLDTPGLPPMLPGGLPVVGHAVEMRTGPVQMIARGRAMFGDMFSLRCPARIGVAMTGHAAQERYFRLQATTRSASARRIS